MNPSIRSIRSYHYPPAIFIYPNSNQLGCRTAASMISSRQATTVETSAPENPHNMDKTKSQNEKIGLDSYNNELNVLICSCILCI